MATATGDVKYKYFLCNNRLVQTKINIILLIITND